MSPRIALENELADLRKNMELIAKAVLENYLHLFMAWKNKNQEEMEKIKRTDKAIAAQQREIESQCLFLIAKQQPIVGDLRTVTACLKAVSDVERVGDHVSDIAELLLRLDLQDASPFSSHVEGMAEATREMYEGAIEAFVKRDTVKANWIIKQDDVVDSLFNKVKADIIESLKIENKDADECVNILLLAKYLEKIADHAVNISQWEIYQETGEIKAL